MKTKIAARDINTRWNQPSKVFINTKTSRERIKNTIKNITTSNTNITTITVNK
jgi:hypothetical protein